MTLSTHVLDIARGVPASGIVIRLYALAGGAPTLVSQAMTNDDGRSDAPLGSELASGTYEIVFETGVYFARHGGGAFYADIPVRFVIEAERERYHVPLLLSPWGYSTYRGS